MSLENGVKILPEDVDRDDVTEKLKPSEVETSHEEALDPNWRKDVSSILLLTFLYILQGIPLGLAASMPLFLSSKYSGNYAKQAKFSLAFWPFSVKLLWAPFVDSLFLPKVGRRKSWLVPTQYLIGAAMLILSFKVDELMDSDHIFWLTIAFFCVNFLAATQDIVVDGWALTMLRKENVGYASTCNSIGQIIGVFLGFNVFIALESAEFCNNYLRSSSNHSDTGIITLPGFLFFWSWVYFGSTTLVWIFKKEIPIDHEEAPPSLMKTYKTLWEILRLPAVKIYMAFLLTCKIGFAPADAITHLKLIEAGVSKDRLALLNVPLTPFKVILPLLISRYTAGRKPMSIFVNSMPPRLLFDLIFAAVVFATPRYFMDSDKGFSWWFYALLIVLYVLHTTAGYSMFVASMAFHARVSDPLIGGSYMTLLNTLMNLGSMWPNTLVLALVDPLSSRECTKGEDGQDEKCVVTVDGYYILSGACFLIGLVYIYAWGRPTMRKLQRRPKSDWRVKRD